MLDEGTDTANAIHPTCSPLRVKAVTNTGKSFFGETAMSNRKYTKEEWSEFMEWARGIQREDERKRRARVLAKQKIEEKKQPALKGKT